MDFPPESQQPASVPPESSRQRPTEFHRVSMVELEQQCHDLRNLLNAALVALVVLSFAVNLFLAKQMRMVRAKVTESRPIIQRMQAEFQRKEPNMQKFISTLQSFATTNPEFQPVLMRYRQVIPQYFSSPIAVSTAPQSAPVPANPAIGQPPPNAGRPAVTK
ncbi:MAG: hypothetical protein IPK15_22110 [Verrucomicrobia bacterium]|nr:hypothetical protein [Verrucomicrobiota bacterium]